MAPAVFSRSNGARCERRAAWLAQQLRQAGDEPVHLYIHHPPFPVGIPAMDRIALRDSRPLRSVLEADPPFGATVRLHDGARGPGWESPAFEPWLAAAVEDASIRHWGMPSASCGVGGTIPFMGMLGEQMPDAQYLLVGVLGPESNAHGPNEFLHLPTVRRVTATVTDVLLAHAARFA